MNDRFLGSRLVTASVSEQPTRAEVLALFAGGSHVSRRRGRSMIATWLRLIASTPKFIICDHPGPESLFAALYRCVVRRSRLLVVAPQPRVPTLADRIVFAAADGVLSAGEGSEGGSPSAQISSVMAPPDLETFAKRGVSRPNGAIGKIVFVGELSPRSGAADFQNALVALAEEYPDRPIDMLWIGGGDLFDVLATQPLPANVSQRFIGTPHRDGLADEFAGVDMMVVPSLTRGPHHPVREALAAGLPVLGSTRNRDVVRLVREGETGWLFDPLKPLDIERALRKALAADPDTLDGIRVAARWHAYGLSAADLADRLHRAILAVDPGPTGKPPSVRPHMGGPIGELG
jgi:glycosyltransferase involved in cell wall biosynthesis